MALAVHTYIPINRTDAFCKEVADFSIRKAVKEQDNQSLQSFCIDKALQFLYDEENLKLAASWIEHGKINVGGIELKTALTPEHKYGIIKSYTASKYFSNEQKTALRVKTFEGDTSDKGHQV